jgi:hypothetical protein
MSATAIYQARQINPHRRRRTNDELKSIYDAAIEILASDPPMTVRHVYYRLVSEGLIPKTEASYDAVVRYLVKLRRSGEIPYSWISDSTRWIRKPRTYDSGSDALRITAKAYRRSLWANQDAYVELWVEKDALAGVLIEETDPYDVPLMVSRGFASITYLYESAQAIKEQEKPAFIYLLTDHDPSGLTAAKQIAEGLADFALDFPITFERLAVTEQQITEWDLPSHWTKPSTHNKDFRGESVELDAIPPRLLRGLVRDAIERHVDPFVLEQTRNTERLEREVLAVIANAADNTEGFWR